MGRFLRILSLLTLAQVVLGTKTCSEKGQRRAWHTFSNEEKSAYIDAELCLMEKPATLGLPAAQTRFDEFQAMHQLQAYATHFVGGFLPFHCAMLHAHETALRTECSYSGWQPYWQEQLDAGNFASSIVFDPVFGFGGGLDAQGCVTTGPFAHYVNHLGPGYENTDHCIDRQINETYSAITSQRDVDECLVQPDWVGAWPCIENKPHIGGHGGVGLQMLNPVSSPGDPLFYLHHTWLDKMWADWQARDSPKRLMEMGGSNIMSAEGLAIFPPRPPYIPQPTGADGDPGTETTLTHVLNMYGNGPNRTIAEVMDIGNHLLCYEYVEPGYGEY